MSSDGVPVFNFGLVFDVFVLHGRMCARSQRNWDLRAPRSYVVRLLVPKQSRRNRYVLFGFRQIDGSRCPPSQNAQSALLDPK